MTAAPAGPRPARPWRIVVGVLMFLMFFGTTRIIVLDNTVTAVSSLVRLLLSVGVFLIGAVWLIGSGLAKRQE